MVSGAGSVAVSARPILPLTVFTSGRLRMSLSVCCNNSCALPIEMAGKVVGIYIKSPSSSSGINSVPSFVAGQRPMAAIITANKIIVLGAFNTSFIKG